ncbi:MAG: hypothetical protein H0V01_12500 [Bacteroidetes bacterium]|nr:hypothetical protein [Bacteroidota bacterium]HET6245881.1 hypothetical protein [Bacteroidia bacterium]
MEKHVDGVHQENNIGTTSIHTCHSFWNIAALLLNTLDASKKKGNLKSENINSNRD